MTRPQGLADLLGGRRTVGPEKLEDRLLQFGE
jgi:hypothetical protein